MRFWKGDRKNVWLLGVLVGGLCIVIGAAYGQFTVIWKKAVMICLECIGIG